MGKNELFVPDSKSLPMKRVKRNEGSEKEQKIFTFASDAIGTEFII